MTQYDPCCHAKKAHLSMSIVFLGGQKVVVAQMILDSSGYLKNARN